MRFTSGINGGGGIQYRYFPAAYDLFFTGENRGNECGALVNIEHLEHIIAGSRYHDLILSKKHRLEHIHSLSDIGHFYPVAVIVENVQIYGSYHGITQGVLLEQKTRISARLHVEPVTPFINKQPDPLRWIISVHYLGMSFNDGLHFERGTKCFPPVFLVKLCGRALIRPVRINGIMMNGKGLHPM